ncbi:hypothetical protein TWF106_008191 [Orbilia oligospora]|uniref:Uncharacterized protein n=1 Tax=Orbilia oligospora TaxID=2813651 RepID=A0A6G1MJR1_ORBOL|nr:hypothetical protein TWF679_005211 [Orbilia oligospora]KAF3216792.1 hypothetical protein TWF106_008191 [Orbilia oligospora]KAF3223213.1 hypothetical protein TWF191_006493 [Orbilia oligospora]KAF3259647.1 hypothetical protein TWF192_010505 [Orbilia oligospora]
MAAAGTAAAAADTGLFSPVHGRPIRPLPKRTLRDRLSPESSKAILSPPAPPNPTPLFYLPYTYPPPPGGSTGSPSGHGSHEHNDSSDEDDVSNASVGRFSSSGQLDDAHDQGIGGPNDGGYDWSENTNNKKKRKIPTPAHPGGASSNGFTTTGHNYATQYSQVSTGTSVHSTPRRYRSAGTQRSPLSTLSSGGNGGMRRVKRFPGTPSAVSGAYSESGNKSPGAGGTDDAPNTPDKENRFERPGINAPTSPFTFKCDSPVSANLAYSHPPPNVGANYQRSMSTVGTQTSPNMSGNNSYPQQQKKKSAARAAARREYLQQQRLKQRHANGNKGEIWICEFCEYEAIFGQPPEALMRQYDIRDRRERRERKEAENRRRRAEERLQRKGRKTSTKNTKKQHAHTNAHSSAHNAPPPPPPPSQTDSQGTQSDHTPIPSATTTPALKPHHPGKNHHHHHHHHVHGDGCQHDHREYGNGTAYRNGHGGS